MYNSITVRILMKMWNALAIGYKHSLLNRFVSYMIRNISTLSRGSYIARLFISNRSLLEESLFYIIYSNSVDFINRFIKSIRDWVGKYNSKSIAYNTF